MKKLLCLLSIFISLSSAHAKEHLNIYNWSNFIDSQTIKEFEQEHNINVNYDVYDSDHTLEAKLYVGQTGYDIVVPSAFPFLIRQSKLGLYEKLDLNKLPNYKNLDKKILGLLKSNNSVDKYGIPWMWGTVGIGYNKKMVEEKLGVNKIDSWKYIFDKENLSKLSGCGVIFMDAPNEIIPALLFYLGLDPNTENKQDLAKAKNLLKELRPYVTQFHSSKYLEDLANKDICIAIGFSGDLIQARDKGKEMGNGDIEFVIPKEGTQIWVDTIAILNDSKNKDNAYKFVNYLLDHKVSAYNTNLLGYANGNEASKKFINKDILADKTIYIDDEMIKKSYILKPLSSDIERLRSNIWIEVVGTK